MAAVILKIKITEKHYYSKKVREREMRTVVESSSLASFGSIGFQNMRVQLRNTIFKTASIISSMKF